MKHRKQAPLRSDIAWSTPDRIGVFGYDLPRELIGHVNLGGDYSTLWSNATPTTLEMAGRVRDFMNNFFWLFARQDRRKLSRSLRLDFPRSSMHTKNSSMQVMLVI